MKEATKRARIYLTWNLIDFLYKASEQRPYTRKELFQQSIDSAHSSEPEVVKETRNTRWQTQILGTLIERKLVREEDQNGQTFYALNNPTLARIILEEWEDDNGMLVRGLVFPNEVEFDTFFAKRVREDVNEGQQVPLPSTLEEGIESELEDDRAEEVITHNIESKDSRFVARLVFLLTKRYNDSTSTLNNLLERMIDAVGAVRSDVTTLITAVRDSTDAFGSRLGEIEKKTGGYNKRLDTFDRHMVDLASAVRNATQRDSGQIIAGLREVLEPLLKQQKPETIAEAVAQSMTDMVTEIKKNTQVVERVHTQQENRQKSLKLLADSLAANMREAEALRLLILEQCGEKK
jgi:hypothetical protein